MFDLENAVITVSRKVILPELVVREPYVSCNFRVCIINSGKAIWQISGKLHTINRGDVVLLDNHQKRMFVDVLSENGVDITIIDFEPQFIINTPFAGLFLREDKYNCLIAGIVGIGDLSESIQDEQRKGCVNNHLIIGAKLVEILALIDRHFNSFGKSGYTINEDIYRALEYIKKHYTTDISLSDVANMLHMSTYNLSKLFSKHMKMGFSEYVTQKRVHHAVHLLENTDKTVLAIALECGFNNAANFYKAFKKLKNKPPGHFRQLRHDHHV